MARAQLLSCLQICVLVCILFLLAPTLVCFSWICQGLWNLQTCEVLPAGKPLQCPHWGKAVRKFPDFEVSVNSVELMRMFYFHRGLAAPVGHALFLIPGLEFCLSELQQWPSSNLRVWTPQNQTLLVCQCYLLLSCQVCWDFSHLPEWELQGAGAMTKLAQLFQS